MSRREGLAWIVAALSLTWGASGILTAPTAPREDASAASAESSRPDELADLRVRLAAARSEAGALRGELDRMRGLLGMKEASDAAEKALGLDQIPDTEKLARAERAIEQLDELAIELQDTSDPAVFQKAQHVIQDLFRAPMDAPGPFLGKYATSDDLMVRRMILPHLAARLGPGLADWVRGELDREEDPELRAELVSQVRVHGSAEEDPVAREVLVSALREPDARARQSAIEALATAGDPQARDALLELAASEPDESVRELVIRQLARDPEARDRLLETVSMSPSPRLRSLAECAVTLAGTAP